MPIKADEGSGPAEARATPRWAGQAQCFGGATHPMTKFSAISITISVGFLKGLDKHALKYLWSNGGSQVVWRAINKEDGTRDLPGTRLVSHTPESQWFALGWQPTF